MSKCVCGGNIRDGGAAGDYCDRGWKCTAERAVVISDAIPRLITQAESNRIRQLEEENARLKEQVADFEQMEWAQTTDGQDFVKDIPAVFSEMLDNAKDKEITRLREALGIAAMILDTVTFYLGDQPIGQEARKFLKDHADIIEETKNV